MKTVRERAIRTVTAERERVIRPVATAQEQAAGKSMREPGRIQKQEEKNFMGGCVHIYCGDGKGKTTAAVGQAVRAAGRGKKVLIARFLKTDDSGEIGVLAGLSGITVLPCAKTFGFYSQMTEEQKRSAAEYYNELLQLAWQRAEKEDYDMLVLDEIMAACRYGLTDENDLVQKLESLRKSQGSRSRGLEVVMTGRNPSERMIELADYVSEIRKVKHPYDNGLSAREGIEY